MTKPIKTVIVAIAVLIALSLAKDAIVKTAVEAGVKTVTGLPLKMGGLRIGIIRTLVGIKDLTLFNPQNCPDKVMLAMPEIYVDYNLTPLFRGKVHLQKMRINLKEFVIVKNRDGEVNLNSLKVVKAEKEKKRPVEVEKAKGKTPAIQIDVLELKIEKVVYKDYSRGASPTVKEFDININERYENIKDPYSLVSIILVRALTSARLGNLLDIDLGALKGQISDTLATASKVATEAAVEAETALRQGARQADAAAHQAADKAERAARGAAEDVKKAADELKDKFKLPFGGE